MTNCNEYGAIVAEQRVARGKKPWDNTPVPVHDIIGPKTEFKFKAPVKQVVEESKDTGGASGSGGTGDAPEPPPPNDDSHTYDRADQAAPSNSKGKRKGKKEPQDQGSRKP